MCRHSVAMKESLTGFGSVGIFLPCWRISRLIKIVKPHAEDADNGLFFQYLFMYASP